MLTGKGHLTDQVIKNTFKDNGKDVEVIFDFKAINLKHPNTLDIIAKYSDKEEKIRYYSIGGGTIEIEGEDKYFEKDIYHENSFDEIRQVLLKRKINLVDYVLENEDDDFLSYLEHVYEIMKEAIKRGLEKDGLLPGELKVERKAKKIISKNVDDPKLLSNKKVFAYAYATSEENASGGLVVTAPTCGSCGVLPAVLYSMDEEVSHDKIIEALMVAGIIGNIVKNNASISGAEAGCQAEIGVACAMAASAYAYLLGGDINEIERSAEIALEHHLGLTCDPVLGYVQIPCIERNAVCALRAIDSAKLVIFLDTSSNKISFDYVVNTMLETGHDLNSNYRETALGGLAKKYKV